MQPSSAPRFGGVGVSSPHVDHQYAIEGYCKLTTGTNQLNVPTSCDHSPQLLPMISQPADQGIEPPSSTPVRHLSKQYGSSKVISEGHEVKSADDVGPHEHMQSSQPTPIFTASHTGARQILPSHPHFDLNCNFAPVTLAPQDNMHQKSQPQSSFSPEVEAFTRSYLSSLSSSFPVLPAFAPPNPRTSSLTTQVKVQASQLPSTRANMTSPSQSSGGIAMEGANKSRSNFEESLNVAPDLGYRASVKVLGITGAPEISSPSTPQVHSRNVSDRSAPSTPKEGSKGEFSGDTYPDFDRSLAPSPSSTPQNINSKFVPQEKRELSFHPSMLETGFTPLLQQQESDRAINRHQHPRKKLRLSDKETSIQTTRSSSPTASFGPLLHPARNQDQSNFVQSSSYDVQANSSTFSSQPSLSNAGGNILLLSLDREHAEDTRSEMAKLVPPEAMERVEIRTLAVQALIHDASIRTVWASNFPKPITQERLSALHARQVASRRAAFVHWHSPPHGPLKTFHPFPRLPTELQHRIWILSLPGPRTIHLTCPPSGLEFFLPKNKPPVTLHINSQSRAVALRTLRPAFENAWLVGAYTHFDFSLDTLRLGDGSGVFTAMTIAYSSDPNIVRDRERVQHLEIPFPISHTTHSYNCLASLISKAPERGWPGIRTLTFTGDAENGGKPKRMPIVEVERGNVVVNALVKIIRGEFRMVYEEFWFMPDCGLKIVYLVEGDE